MRYGLIADLHANIEALSEVFKALDQLSVDHVVCLGDIVGYAATPTECIDLLRERKVRSISGNHDRYVTGTTPMVDIRQDTAQAVEWTKGVLQPGHLGFLQGLPKQRLAEPSIMLVHGSPRHEDEYILGVREMTENLQLLISHHADVKVCFFGHTHHPVVVAQGTLITSIPEDKKVALDRGKTYLINPGSVGQPRDGVNRSAFGVFDTLTWTMEFYRVPYNIQSIQDKIRAAGLSERFASRLAQGR